MTRSRKRFSWLRPPSSCLTSLGRSNKPQTHSRSSTKSCTDDESLREIRSHPVEDPCSCADLVLNGDFEELVSMQLTQSLDQVEWEMSHPLGWALDFLRSQSNHGQLDVSQWYRDSAQLNLDAAPLFSTNPFAPELGQTWTVPLAKRSKGVLRRLVYHVSVGQLGIICHSNQGVTAASPSHLALTIRTWFPNAPMGFGKKFYSETVFCCSKGADPKTTDFKILWKSWFHKSVPMKGTIHQMMRLPAKDSFHRMKMELIEKGLAMGSNLERGASASSTSTFQPLTPPPSPPKLFCFKFLYDFKNLRSILRLLNP